MSRPPARNQLKMFANRYSLDLVKSNQPAIRTAAAVPTPASPDGRLPVSMTPGIFHENKHG
jgi:hypothetical protein